MDVTLTIVSLGPMKMVTKLTSQVTESSRKLGTPECSRKKQEVAGFVHSARQCVTCQQRQRRREKDKECPMCNSTLHLPPWAGFVPKLTTTLTVTETKIPVLAHVAFLCRTLTNPLEHGDANTTQARNSLRITKTHAQLSPNLPPMHAWLGRPTVPPLGT